MGMSSEACSSSFSLSKEKKKGTVHRKSMKVSGGFSLYTIIRASSIPQGLSLGIVKHDNKI